MHVSKLTGVIAYSGGQIVLREGQTVDDDHPIIAERPELFQSADEGNEQKAQTPNPRTVETTMAEGPGGGRVRRTPRQVGSGQ